MCTSRPTTQQRDGDERGDRCGGEHGSRGALLGCGIGQRELGDQEADRVADRAEDGDRNDITPPHAVGERAEARADRELRAAEDTADLAGQESGKDADRNGIGDRSA